MKLKVIAAFIVILQYCMIAFGFCAFVKAYAGTGPALGVMAADLLLSWWLLDRIFPRPTVGQAR